MKAIFTDVLIDKLNRENLGIAHGCLYHFIQHVEDVISKNAVQLANRKDFSSAYSELEEFVDRMIKSAKAQGNSELHEPNFFDAKGQCGLIFWC